MDKAEQSPFFIRRKSEKMTIQTVMRLLILGLSCILVVWKIGYRIHVDEIELQVMHHEDRDADTAVKDDKQYFDTFATDTVFHLVPHSHCDASYKKTFDEYYETEVRTVLSSMPRALEELNTSRRFVWAETSYLTRWWKDSRTSPRLKEVFHSLLTSGQLEIVNGGWVMHDEGITRYDSQIHQMALGHDRLRQIFVNHVDIPDIDVSTGWQIDSFGPSPFTVNFHQWAGMNFLVLNRIPEEVKASLKSNQSLQFYWETPNCRILVHVMDTHYSSPDGFNWEDLEYGGPAPIDGHNVQERSDVFMKILRDRATLYRTPHVLVPMGGDFTFQNASWHFQNMERITRFVLSHPERYGPATFRYSTAREYKTAMLDFLDKSNATLPTVRGGVDFQPYFTGYYFQLPVLKQALRSCEIVLRMLETRIFRGLNKRFSEAILAGWLQEKQRVRETVALMQHHDAISATSYRFVIANYMQQLASIMTIMTEMLLKIDGVSGDGTGTIIGGGPYIHETVLIRNAQSARSISLDKIVNPRMGFEGVYLSVLNSLGQTVNTLIHFVCSREDVAISLVNENGSTSSVVSQATPLETELEVGNLGLFLISFPATVKAMSGALFRCQVCDLTWNTFQKPASFLPSLVCATRALDLDAQQLLSEGIRSSQLHITFNDTTMELSRIETLAENGYGRSLSVDHDFILYYGGSDTVYEFNTNVASSGPPPLFGNRRRRLTNAIRGPLFSQVTLEYTPWLSVRYRLINQTGSVADGSLQTTVFAGPLPPSVNLASRFCTDLKETSWFVDQNGFLPIETRYNISHGVGDGNARPVVSRTWLREKQGRRFSILSVDPRAAVSKNPGDLEIFWHRRNKNRTDWWKQGDDKSSVVSSVWLTFDSGHASAEKATRMLSIQLANDVVLLSVPETTDAINMPPIAEISSNLHIVSSHVSSSDSEIENDRSDILIDLQIENLSADRTESINLSILLHQIPKVILPAAALYSLTHLPHDETSEGCNLEIRNGKETILSIGARRICTVQIPLSPLKEGYDESSGYAAQLT